MFSSVALNIEAPLSDSAVSRPLEASCQDEYYRASFQLLGNLYLKPEWAGTQLTGWVDFAIPSERWIIECVQDGDKLNEHIEHFQMTGKYGQWISNQKVQDFILLDFRRSIPRKQRSMYTLSFSSFPSLFSSTTIIPQGPLCWLFLKCRAWLAFPYCLCWRFLLIYCVRLRLQGCSGWKPNCFVVVIQHAGFYQRCYASSLCLCPFGIW